MLRTLVLCSIALAGLGRPVDAALISGDVGGALAQTASFALLPDGPAGPITVFAGTEFETTLSAPDGLYAVDGILSTTFDEDTIVLTSSSPISGLGFSGGIVGDPLQPIAGEVEVLIRGESLSFVLPASSSTFGVLSTAPFTEAVLSISSFDTSATSVAFLGLDAVSVRVQPVPLPATLPALGAALGLLVSLRRPRRARR